MQTMKAALYSGIEQIGVREVPRQSPAPGYVLLDTRQSGICGSDLHNYWGHWNPSLEQAQGHEVAGVVVEIGEGAADIRAIDVGDHVAIECFSHCGSCVYCRTGQYTHCLQRAAFAGKGHGGFAQYTTAHASSVFKLPPGMSFAQGAMVEPLAVGVRALAQAGSIYPDRVAVIGGGTIGLLCLAVAKAIGVGETLITVKYPQQAEVAAALGADHIVSIGESDVGEVARDISDGLGMDAVIETVGGGQNFDTALNIVRKRGAVVLVAGYYKPLEVDLRRIVATEAIVTGSMCYAYSGLRTDFDVAIDMIATGKVDATALVTHRFDLDDIAEAFAVAADKESGSVKVHICQ